MKPLEQPIVLWQDGWHGSYLEVGSVPLSSLGELVRQAMEQNLKVVGIRIDDRLMCQVMVARSGGRYHE